jgi:hypothetical protein
MSVDVRKWRIPVRMRRPLASFPGALQTVVEGLEQVPHGGVTHAMALLPQLLGQAARTLTGPAQGRHRIPTSRRLHEGINRLEELLVLRGAGLTPCPVASHPARSITA